MTVVYRVVLCLLECPTGALDTAPGDSTRGAQEGQIIGRYNSLQDLGLPWVPFSGIG